MMETSGPITNIEFLERTSFTLETVSCDESNLKTRVTPAHDASHVESNSEHDDSAFHDAVENQDAMITEELHFFDPADVGNKDAFGRAIHLTIDKNNGVFFRTAEVDNFLANFTTQ